jgi:hypothetical protein
MQSHAIDVIIWDNTADMAIVASAVSPQGLGFLRSLTCREDTSSIQVECSPEEFIQEIPPGMEVAYNRTDSKLVKLMGINPLQ